MAPPLISAQRPRRSRMPTLALVLATIGTLSLAFWSASRVMGQSFVGVRVVGNARALRAQSGVPRQYSFGLVETEEHNGLIVENTDDGIAVMTNATGEKGSKKALYKTGWWNTVLGDTELPANGRAYWEVKVLDKPTNAWEYIGVAEAKSDVTKPLTRNQKGQGWFMGATNSESMVYRYLPIDTAKWQADLLAEAKEVMTLKAVFGAHQVKVRPKLDVKPANSLVECGVNEKFEKELEAAAETASKSVWGASGTHVGAEPNLLPPIKTGTVVGLDLDADAGTLSFWVDGKYYGPLREYTGKPVDFKGKKLVPALSVFGRRMGPEKQFTQMEVRTGLEPPARP